MRPADIKDMRDAVKYCTDHIADLGVLPDSAVACNMVGIVGSDLFDGWYEDATFAELFELVADLEVPAVGTTGLSPRRQGLCTS